MNDKLKNRLISIAKEKIVNDDISHDLEHALRVLANAERICNEEGGDLDVIIPSALFHDIIVYPKNHPKSKDASDESAELAKEILENIKEYPKERVGKVYTAIKQCSFSKGIIPELKEAKILQDADKLESTGVISIMRTFSSSGQMLRPYYNSDDPFCENREPEDLKYSVDVFYSRLLRVKDRMHTKKAKKIAERREKILLKFLDELKLE